MNKLNLIWILVLLFIVPVSAYSYIFESGEPSDIRISCFDTTNLPCDASTVCHITIFTPNSSVMVDNQTMTRGDSYYNYTLGSSLTEVTGEYSAVSYCDGSTNDYTSFTYLITPNGEDPSTATGIMYMGLFSVLVILLIISIVGVLNVKSILGKYVLIGVSYLLFVAVSFITWNLASNFLTSAPFLISMSWIIFRILLALLLPFFLCSFLFYLYEYRKMQQIKSLLEKGVPEDEAFARTLKRGKKKW